MRINWTLRGRKRFTAISNYIAEEFYSEYADAWEEDVATTVEHLADNPKIGTVAFPSLKRPELRRILLSNRNYWVYYRLKKSTIDILSVKHILQNVKSLRNL